MDRIKELKMFGDTVCNSVALLFNGTMVRVSELKTFEEKLQIEYIYKYFQNKIYKI